jgi:hypothetical protein
MTKKLPPEKLLEEIERLKELAAVSADTCLSVLLIAVSNQDIQSLLVTKLEAGFIFRAWQCPSIPTTSEERLVIFEFDCAPGTISLLPATFACTVNIVEKRVIRILDPYLGQFSARSTTPSAVPFSLASPSLAPTVVTPVERVIPMQMREREYLQARGLWREREQQGGGGDPPPPQGGPPGQPTSTNCSTWEPIITYSWKYDPSTGTTQYIIDDSTSHTVTDLADDPIG